MLEVASLHNKGRIAYIDAVKAICIFLMVVGHFTSDRILLSYIYSFHMPAFFIVSGFLYKTHTWKKTIVAFSVPVVLFSLINLAIYLLLGIVSIDHLSLHYIVIHVFEWRHGLDGEALIIGIWFIWALAGLRLLFGDISGIKVGRKTYMSIATIITICMFFENSFFSIDTLFHGYYIGTIIPSLPFFCIGMYLNEIHWVPQYIESKKLIIPLALLFLFIPATKNYCDIYNSDYGYSYLIAALFATLFTLLLFWLTSKLPSTKFMETISKGTLIVLGLHKSILQSLIRLLPDSIDFLYPFITIVLCYYIIIICEKYCPIMLGRVKLSS